MLVISRAHGLRLATNRPIPGLIPSRGDVRADVHVQLGGTQAARPEAWPDPIAAHPESRVCEHGRPVPIALGGGADGFRMRYEDGTDFVIDRRGTRIWASWHEPMTLEDAAVYLLGPVLAFALRLRGVTCLHASAVVVDAGVVALVGPSGVGKSTTVAAFAERGFAVLCDDTLALEERESDVIAHPGYPRLRLWPEAVHLLHGEKRSLPRLTPNWEKRYLDLQQGGYRYARDPGRLRGIYLLEARRTGPTAPGVSAVSASTGLLSLLANLRSDCFPDKASHRREFDMLGRLADRVPIRRVGAPRGRPGLVRLCDTILDDLATVAEESGELDGLTCTI
ncbi:MAG: hypothetical protein GWN21_01695 [Gammaproteobacteria bacterium]|nr:hypothetical protein [Gammaproteobacteria bacterium]NIR22551.1 hypothetical protein [Gammaproteobacteria bacterium]NIS04123.1 hypothetical protein [Gammaproteobacteria bacterium]NIU42175.1 hypothetical protein [Gammaproteobacteria bacterium]NIV46138.1 hypothetical protein [Gammaproteobacteria bacterium]